MAVTGEFVNFDDFVVSLNHYLPSFFEDVRVPSRFALLKLSSRYQVANVFLQEIGEALCTLGHEVAYLDPSHSNGVSEWSRIARFGPSWIVSINGVALDLQLEGQPLPQAFGARHLSITVDNPLLFGSRWQKSGDGLLTVLAPDMIELTSGYWPQVGTVLQMSHGGCGTPYPVEGERPIDVLFSGTYDPPASCRDRWDRFPKQVQDWLHENTDRLALSTDANPWSVGTGGGIQELCAHGLGQAELEASIRAVRRHELVRSLTRSRVQAMLVGEGWESHPDAAHHHLLGPRPFLELMELFRRAKLVLHGTTSPDSHERPLTAMLGGAAVVCDGNRFFSTQFTPGVELSTFRWEDVALVGESVRQLLEETSRLRAVAGAGQRAAVEGHTWLHRLATLPLNIERTPIIAWSVLREP